MAELDMKHLRSLPLELWRNRNVSTSTSFSCLELGL